MIYSPSLLSLFPARPASRFVSGAVLAIAAALIVAGCGGKTDDSLLSGYVEADLAYVSAPASGWIVKSQLKEGDTAKAGDLLYQLDSDKEAAVVNEASERLRQAEASLRDLETGKRPEEIDALTAQLEDARAALRLASAELERQSRLQKRGVTSESAFDQAKAGYESAIAKVQTAEANISVARLGGRKDALEAAKAERAAAAAVVAQAKWQLDQRSISAKREGRVEEIFQRTGEYVTAGTPLLALLPDDAVKVRFFVPEAILPEVTVGRSIDVLADHQTEALKAKVSFIAREAEFTPPVIYSSRNRDKLVFLVEARFDRPAKVRPGQPVDVRLP